MQAPLVLGITFLLMLYVAYRDDVLGGLTAASGSPHAAQKVALPADSALPPAGVYPSGSGIRVLSSSDAAIPSFKAVAPPLLAYSFCQS